MTYVTTVEEVEIHPTSVTTDETEKGVDKLIVE